MLLSLCLAHASLSVHPAIADADVGGLASHHRLSIAFVGGVATWVAYQTEDADAEARFLQKGIFDSGSDLGNIYGDIRFMSGATLGLWTIGEVCESSNCTTAAKKMAASLVATTATVASLKGVIERTRPDGGDHSFPSGHTATAFSVAPILAHHFGRRVAIPAYTLATCTALGRMEDRRHYLSDVVFGATIGLVVGETMAHSSSGFLNALNVDEHGLELQYRF